MRTEAATTMLKIKTINFVEKRDLQTHQMKKEGLGFTNKGRHIAKYLSVATATTMKTHPLVTTFFKGCQKMGKMALYLKIIKASPSAAFQYALEIL